MGTGLKSWYIIRRVTAEWSISYNIPPEIAQMRESWVYCDFRFGQLLPEYTPDKDLATPFKTREQAELKAFAIIQGDKDLLHNVKVVLR